MASYDSEESLVMVSYNFKATGIEPSISDAIDIRIRCSEVV